MSHQRKHQDPQIEGAPDEEDIDRADAVERLAVDPEEQENFPDRPGHQDADTVRENRKP
jgi:hypothetical protein